MIVGIDTLDEFRVVTESWTSRGIRVLKRLRDLQDLSRSAAKMEEITLTWWDSWIGVRVPSGYDMTSELWMKNAFG